MNDSAATRADAVLFGLFALFVFSSTFSIALAQSSLGLALAVFLAISIARRENPFGGSLKALYITIGLYILWMAVSSLFGRTPGRSLLMEREDWLFFVIPITVYLLRHETGRRWLPRVLAVGMLVMAVYGIVQHYTGFHWPEREAPVSAPGGLYFIQGTFTHHLTYGNYFAMASCFSLAYGVLAPACKPHAWRAIIIIAALIGLAATVLSLARTATAALPVALLLLAALKGRRWLLVSLMVVAVGSAGAYLWVPGVAERYQLALEKDLAGESQAARGFIWGKSLQIVSQNPVTGVGLGNFYEAYREQNNPELGEHRVWPHAHNDVLSIAAVSGIPGALLFVALWAVVFMYFRSGWKRLRDWPAERALVGAAMTGSLVFALCSITEATFADEETRQLLMFFWGAGLAWVHVMPRTEAARLPRGAAESLEETRQPGGAGTA